MASEVKTTVTTEAGLMERAQASLTSRILWQSKLLQACSFESLSNAASVQFPLFSAPDPTAADQITEGNRGGGIGGATPRTITIGSKIITLLAFNAVTSQSKVSLRGGSGVSKATKDVLAGNVCSAVDKYIASLFTVTNFTTYGSTGTFVGEASVITYNAFLNAKTALLNTGYSGQLKACLSFYQINKIRQDMKTAYFPKLNDQISTSGYMGTLDDVEIYGLPSGWLPTATINSVSKKVGLMWVDGFGLGACYDNIGTYGGLVEITEIPLHVDVEIGATAFMNATSLTSGSGNAGDAVGGVLLASDSSSV